MDTHDLPDTLDFLGSRWFWISAGLLAAACVGLLVAFYLRHPERNLWEDFQRRGPVDHATSNGHVPGAASRPGVDIVEGVAAQGED